MKTCTKCGKMKSADEFCRHRRSKDGREGRCKMCKAIQGKAYYAAHREYELSRNHQQREQRKAEDPIAYRKRAFERNLRRKYGLTYEQYRAMWVAQCSKCAICNRKILLGPAPSRKSHHPYAVVDHDHTTKKVRALLCNQCNVDLPSVERPGWQKKAIAYLQYHGRGSEQ